MGSSSRMTSLGVEGVRRVRMWERGVVVFSGGRVERVDVRGRWGCWVGIVDVQGSS